MLNIVSKVAVLVLAAGLAGGCATQGDLDKLKDSIAQTDRKADDAAAAAAAALAAAERAEAKAGDAESAAMRAESEARAANSKLDQMFRHTMMK